MAAAEKMLTLEQMRILMQVAGSDNPQRTAEELLGKWLYILGLARAAQKGLHLDSAFPQVTLDCDEYARRAGDAVAILEEWLAERCPEQHPKRVRLGESIPGREEGG